MNTDYYKLLGVSRDASLKEIKTAFRTLAKKYHPDLCGSRPECKYRFEEVMKAYKVLSNPEKRMEYDSSMNLRASHKHGGAARVSKKQVVHVQPDYYMCIRYGKKLERAGRFADAEKYYRKAVAIQPDSVEANYRLGCCLGNQDKFYDAYIHLHKAIKAEPKNGLLLCAYGQCLEREGKLIGAEQAYRLALKLSPDEFEILYSLGACLLAQCKHWQNDKSTDFYPFLTRSGALEWKKRTWKMVIKEAEYYLKLAYQKKPTNFNVNYKLGWCYLEQNLIEDAQRKFLTALRLKPDSKLARKGLAECELKFLKQIRFFPSIFPAK